MPEWTTRSEMKLKSMNRAGATPEEIHEELPDHTVCAIRKKAYDLGLSWRKKGSLRGLVIGQPRGVSLKKDAGVLQRLVKEGRISPVTIAIRLSAESKPVPMCPKCGKRPAVVRRTGLCRLCHKQVLIDVQNEQLEEIERTKAQRKVWQRKSRAKRDQ